MVHSFNVGLNELRTQISSFSGFSLQTVEVRNTQVKLPRQLLLPGHRYEARVGVKVSVGHWSDWSPLVTWKNKEGESWNTVGFGDCSWFCGLFSDSLLSSAVDPGQLPSLRCVLVTEREVICSWEVTRERATFITYQLVCRRNQTAPWVTCDDDNTTCFRLNETPASFTVDSLKKKKKSFFQTQELLHDSHRHCWPKHISKVQLLTVCPRPCTAAAGASTDAHGQDLQGPPTQWVDTTVGGAGGG